MAGEMEQLFSVVGRVYVMLRRETNRMIDVEWAIANADYAREVIKLARTTQVNELIQLAARIEDTHPLLPRISKLEVAPTKEGLKAAQTHHY
ncbi:MAG: hypothetical protein AUJ88_01960 [Gallionellaceae bacterium CG1_02_56_997]|nr:MAG: hypothetical protein AUJ88_01960 [Gallionellaceae bacterium CG1_02_56_997]